MGDLGRAGCHRYAGDGIWDAISGFAGGGLANPVWNTRGEPYSLAQMLDDLEKQHPVEKIEKDPAPLPPARKASALDPTEYLFSSGQSPLFVSPSQGRPISGIDSREMAEAMGLDEFCGNVSDGEELCTMDAEQMLRLGDEMEANNGEPSHTTPGRYWAPQTPVRPAMNTVDNQSVETPQPPPDDGFALYGITEEDTNFTVETLFAEYGLPPQVAQTYIESGIISLYPWQVECLEQPGVLQGDRNLIYSAPTSAGKTMVAELLMLKKVVTAKKKAIFILPYVAIVVEKTKFLQKMFATENLKIVGYYSNTGSSNFDDVDIAVCTIEKANTLVNRLIKEDHLDDVGIVVVDELHLVSEPPRGYIVETLLNKVKYKVGDDVQIIGMSATIPRIEVLAKWLEATLYTTEYRPVPLTEYYKVGDTVFDVDGNKVRKLTTDCPHDPDFFVREVVCQGLSVLVFCASKDKCENATKFLTNNLKLPVETDVSAERAKIVNELSRTPGGLDPILELSVMDGVAFHHGGLTTEEREIIEGAFRAGLIHTLNATSTLSSGVNLPARRVIFREPKMGRGLLSPQEYKQMKGRAGRKGKDVMGESIVMCPKTKREIEEVKRLIKSGLGEIKSCLRAQKPGDPGMERAVLEMIVSNTSSTRLDLQHYGSCTMFEALHGKEAVSTAIDAAIEYLKAKENEFIVEAEVGVDQGDPADVAYQPTKLGSATVASALSPAEALVVFAELKQARENFVLENELHIIYQVTPTYLDGSRMDWQRYYDIYERMSTTHLRTAKAIGIKIGFLTGAASGAVLKNRAEREKKYCRFWHAMILCELVQEVPFQEISQRYGVNRGLLQTLQTSSATFAGMVKIFCEELGWTSLALLVTQFQDRLNFGVEGELLELVQIPHMKGSRARMLWKAGYKTIPQIATASPEEIFNVFWKSVPFKKQKEDSNYHRRIEYRAAHKIVAGAREKLESEEREAAVVAKQKRQILAKLSRGDTPKKTDSSRTRSPRGSNKKMRRSIGTLGTEENRESPQTTPCPTSRKMKTQSWGAAAAPKEMIPDLPGPAPANSLVSAPNVAPRPPPALETELLVQAISHATQHSPVNDVTTSVPGASVIVEVATSAQIFDAFMHDFERADEFVWNTHTRLESNKSRLIGLAVCWRPDEIWYMDLTKSVIDWPRVAAVFAKKTRKISYDVKTQLVCLFRNGVDPSGQLLDPKVAAWLLDPESRERDVKQMCKDVFPNMVFHQSGGGSQRVCREAQQIHMLMTEMRSRLERANLFEHFVKVEMRMAALCASMEYTGVGFVHKEFRTYWDIFRETLQKLELRAYELAGHMFSLTCATAVATVLFDELKLPYPVAGQGSSKIGAAPGQKIKRSTAKDVLLKLVDKHELPSIIMEHRRLGSLVSKHLFPLQHAKVMSEAFGMPRVHCSFVTHTTTGRIMTTNPNLQNIPHPKNRQGPATELDCDSANLRNAFQAAEGMVLVSADYSQLEIRLIAHFSEDKSLLQILPSGGDMFAMIAAQLHKKDVNLVTAEERQKAKCICYGVMYGMGARSLAEDLGADIPTAESFIKRFRDTYPGVEAFKKRVVSDCAKVGAVETLLGRKRFLPAIHSSSVQERAHAERQAVNTTVQGSAADLVKVAMIRIDIEFKKRWGVWYELESTLEARTLPHVVLQIHDELLFEIPESLVDEVKPIIEDCMTHAIDLRVPCPVAIKIGTKWGSLVKCSL